MAEISKEVIITHKPKKSIGVFEKSKELRNTSCRFAFKTGGRFFEELNAFLKEECYLAVLYHFRISIITLSEYPISPSAFFKSSRVSIFTLPTESQQL